MRERARTLLLCLVWGAVLVLAGPGPGGYGVQWTPVTAGRADGAVLVLDVSSLWLKHPTQPSVSTTSPEDCQLRCASLPGCSAFAFCKDSAGCGSGCAAHVAKHPAATPTPPEAKVVRKRGERVEAEEKTGLSLPILGFGPFAPNKATKGCHAQRPDRWPQGTCTLLRATKPGKAAAGAGWVSAWLKQAPPQECSGLSAAACAACFATPDAGACLACMRDKRAKSYIVDVTLISDGVPPGSTGGRTLDQCATCARLPKAHHKQCVNCVLDNDACSSCVGYPGAATQLALGAVGGCMGCVASKGKRFTGTCLTCAAVPDPAKCVKCLDSFYPRHICRSATARDCYVPNFDNPCATCQKSAAPNYDACIACYSRPSSKSDCDSCAQLPGAHAQGHCFDCSQRIVGAHSDMPSGCGLCFAHSTSLATLGQCVGCITGNGTSQANRQWCSLCSAPELSEAQAKRCFSCLTGKAGSPACGVCSRAASTDAAFKSCLACQASSANGPDCRDCTSLGSTPGLSAAARDSLLRQCFDCVAASKLVVPPDAGSAPLGSCQTCFAGKAGDAAACVACNTNPLVPTPAKSWCSSCSALPPAKRAPCVKCLASNPRLATVDAFKAACRL